MHFSDIPAWRVDEDVRRAVAEAVLSACDTAEFLSEEQWGYMDHVSGLFGTKYEDMIPSLISVRKGQSGGMHGMLYRFALDPAVRAHILEEGLEAIFEDGDIVLQNLTLFKGGNVMFFCISHEVGSGWTVDEIDDRLKEDILKAARGVLERDKTYRSLNDICASVSQRDTDAADRELKILSDLPDYVDRERAYFAYSVPEYECTYAEFLRIAKKWLTEETYSELAAADSFFALYPHTGPSTAEDVLEFLKERRPVAGQFLETPFAKKVARELCYISEILHKNNGE